MTMTARRLQILKFLDRATRHAEISITDAARGIGGGFSGAQSRIYELIRLGYLQKHKQDGQFAHVSVSEKGRAAIAGKEPTEAEAENDQPIAGQKFRGPQQKISDEKRRALYRGARYGNYTGREIVDNRPVSRPPTLEGFGTSEVA